MQQIIVWTRSLLINALVGLFLGIVVTGCSYLPTVAPDDRFASHAAPLVTPLDYEQVGTPLLLSNLETPVPSVSSIEAERESSVEKAATAINQNGGLPGISTAKPPVTGKPPIGESDVVELNYEHADLRQVVEELARALKISVVIDPEITGKVTLRTSADRPLRYKDLWPTLKTLLSNNGATIVRQGKVFKVVNLNVPGLPDAIGYDMSKSGLPLVMQIVPLKYIPVDTALAFLNPVLQGQGVINTLPNINTLAISASPEVIKRVNGLLQLLDVNSFKYRGIHIYPLKNADASTVAEELSSILNLVEGGGSTYQVMALERVNSILVVAPPKRGFQEVNRWIKLLDAASQQQAEQVFIYKVKNLKADKLADALTKLFENDRGSSGSFERNGSQSSSQSIVGKNSALTTQLTPANSQALNNTGTPNPLAAAAAANASLPQSPFEQAANTSNNANNTQGQTQTATVIQPVALNNGVTVPTISANLNFKIVADEDTNSLLVRSTGREYQQLLSTINLLDQPPLEVMVDAVIANVTLSDETRAGVDWKRILGGGAAGGHFIGSAFGISSSAAGLVLSDTLGDLTYTLNALRQYSKVKVLSRPSLLVKNNQEATMKVGQKFPITSTTINETTTTSNTTYLDTGIELVVKPQINPDGIISMEIEQRVSRADITTTTSTTSGAPQLSNQEVSTQIVLRDGDVVVLGGLIETTQTDAKDSIPGLGEVPVLGSLFSSNSVQGVRTELLLLLQARVVNPKEAGLAVGTEIRNRLGAASRLLDEGIQSPGWQKFLSMPY